MQNAITVKRLGPLTFGFCASVGGWFITHDDDEDNYLPVNEYENANLIPFVKTAVMGRFDEGEARETLDNVLAGLKTHVDSQNPEPEESQVSA